MTEILPPPLNFKGKITPLLVAGATINQIAKKTGKSYRAVYKKVIKYEREGKIERICSYPLIFKQKKILPPPLSQSEILPPPPLLFHKCGFMFAIHARPALQYNLRGFAHIKEHTHTIQFGRSKATIWINNSAIRGQTPEELLNNAEITARQLADNYSSKFGIHLNYIRPHPQVEWIIADKPASKTLAQHEGIKPKQPPITIAGASYKFDDATHPKYVEIDQATGYPPKIPTEHAKTLHFLLTKAPELLEKISTTMDKMNDTIITINQRLMKVENK